MGRARKLLRPVEQWSIDQLVADGTLVRRSHFDDVVASLRAYQNDAALLRRERDVAEEQARCHEHAVDSVRKSRDAAWEQAARTGEHRKADLERFEEVLAQSTALLERAVAAGEAQQAKLDRIRDIVGPELLDVDDR